VRLRYGYCIADAEVVARDAAGEVTRLRATVLAETAGGSNPTDGRKVSGVIHWVDAATAVPAEVRLVTIICSRGRGPRTAAIFCRR